MRRRGGFTLIELLVVIVIITILAALISVVSVSVFRSQKKTSSESMLWTISSAIAQYQSHWGDCPPSSMDELGERAPNGINNGIESLVACLSTDRKVGRILYQPPENELYTNVDKDQAGRNVTGWFFGNDELREYADFFGYTVTYVHHRDYARPKASILTYKFTESSPETAVQIEKTPNTAAFVGPGKFQLRMVGADGQPGTADDFILGQ